jgi:hypothetical protein
MHQTGLPFRRANMAESGAFGLANREAWQCGWAIPVKCGGRASHRQAAITGKNRLKGMPVPDIVCQDGSWPMRCGQGESWRARAVPSSDVAVANRFKGLNAWLWKVSDWAAIAFGGFFTARPIAQSGQSA